MTALRTLKNGVEYPLKRETTSSGTIGEFQRRDEYERGLEKQKEEHSGRTIITLKEGRIPGFPLL